MAERIFHSIFSVPLGADLADSSGLRGVFSGHHPKQPPVAVHKRPSQLIFNSTGKQGLIFWPPALAVPYGQWPPIA